VKCKLALLTVVIILCGIIVPTALAWTNPCSGDLDPAGCERLTFIAGSVDDVRTGVLWLVGVVLGLYAANTIRDAFRSL